MENNITNKIKNITAIIFFSLFSCFLILSLVSFFSNNKKHEVIIRRPTSSEYFTASNINKSEYSSHKYISVKNGDVISPEEAFYEYDQTNLISTGYVFEGFYIDKDFTTKWELGKDKVYCDLVLYPKYVEI